MYVLVADLDKDRSSFCEEIESHGEPVAQVSEIRMDAQLPGITKSANLLWLPGGICGLAVLYIPLPRAHLPVRPEFDAVGRVEVDTLHLTLETFLLSQ